MKSPDPIWLGLLYGFSELYLGITHRARRGAVSRDKKSLRLLWLVILVSIFFAVQSVFWFPSAAMSHRALFRTIGLFVFVFGLALRWYSIGYLGKFFTVDVAIHSQHRIIETGPYRLVRHPSYTGALLAFVGLGLSMGNWCALAIFTLLPTLAFLARIEVEERALNHAMGEQYRSYQRRTKRLIPVLY